MTLSFILAGVFFAALAAGIALNANADAVASWLYPATLQQGEAWQLVVRHTEQMQIALILFFVAAFGAARYTSDHTRGALDRMLASQLRSASYPSSRVYSMKRRLTRDVVSGRLRADEHFDARAYLLRRHRRTSRLFYIAATLAILASAFSFWRAVTTYTRVTDKAFHEVGGWPLQHQVFRYEDANGVYTNCFLDNKESISAWYEVGFVGGHVSTLVSHPEMPASLDPLKRIDALLRQSGVAFETGGTSAARLKNKRACLQKLAQRYNDPSGLAQIFHLG